MGFVGEAQALDSSEPFSTELLDRLGDVVDSEFATYYEVDAFRRVHYGYVNCSLETRYLAALELTTEWHQVRVSGYAELDVSPNDVGLWSDTIDRAPRWQFECTPFFARAFEVVDCAWTVFELGRFERAVLTLARQGRDFAERDRLRLRALRPHAFALIRNAHARRRLVNLMNAVDSVDEREPRGFLLLSRSFEIQHASPAARQLLGRWFGGFDGRLPALVDDWMRSESRFEPLRLEADGERLTFEAPTGGALVLTEEAAPPASLTSKEVDVLRRIAAGKSTAEIASELVVSPATVSKHLEHIYRKLGVTSRTAALAAVGVKIESLES